MASIRTRPNGSGQSMGKSSASALPRNSFFSWSPISSMNRPEGRGVAAKSHATNIPDRRGRPLPRPQGDAGALGDLDSPVRTFSGAMRPRNSSGHRPSGRTDKGLPAIRDRSSPSNSVRAASGHAHRARRTQVACSGKARRSDENRANRPSVERRHAFLEKVLK